MRRKITSAMDGWILSRQRCGRWISSRDARFIYSVDVYKRQEDDITIKAGRLSGIIKELKMLSDQSIEEIRSSEIEALSLIHI